MNKYGKVMLLIAAIFILLLSAVAIYVSTTLSGPHATSTGPAPAGSTSPSPQTALSEAKALDFIKACLRLVASRNETIYSQLVDAPELLSAMQLKRAIGDAPEVAFSRQFEGYDQLSESVIAGLVVLKSSAPETVEMKDHRNTPEGAPPEVVLAVKLNLEIMRTPSFHVKNQKTSVFQVGEELFWEPFGW